MNNKLNFYVSFFKSLFLSLFQFKCSFKIHNKFNVTNKKILFSLLNFKIKQTLDVIQKLSICLLLWQPSSLDTTHLHSLLHYLFSFLFQTNASGSFFFFFIRFIVQITKYCCFYILETNFCIKLEKLFYLRN